MSVIEDIREQQKKALNEMTLKEKLSYFWYYYKVHLLVAVAVIVLIVTFVNQYRNHKDYAFYATFVNATYNDYTLNDTWSEEFAEYAGIDTDEYSVYIDNSIQLSEMSSSQYAIANQEKLVALMQAGSVGAFVADTETFESYAQFQYFANLEDILTPEQIEKYKDYFYYTDAAAFDSDEDTLMSEEAQNAIYAKVINHNDPSTMEQPIAVGFYVGDTDKMQSSGCYDYLTENDYSFQGYPSEAILGIPVTYEDTNTAIAFLEYLGL